MVCRYLENRICYDSSSGSGGGGTSDEDFDQGLQQDIAAAAAGRTRDNFGFSEDFEPENEDTSALISATRDVLDSDNAARALGVNRNSSIREAERVAASRPNVQTAVSNLMNPNITQPDLSDYGRQDFFNNPMNQTMQGYILPDYMGEENYDATETSLMGLFGENPATRTIYDNLMSRTNRTAPTINAFGIDFPTNPSAAVGTAIGNANMQNVVNKIDQGGVPVMGNGFVQGVNLNGRYSGRPDFDPNRQEPQGDSEQAFPFANQQGQQVAQMAPGEVAPEAIDDLAINYLQNPYYAYSGFGNQFSPYGYAPGTLVDLLQTRGMTQPEQADNLGLFGTPTDFS